MSTTVKVLSAKETLASYTIQKGDVLVVQAKGEVNYQLIDNATGYAPQNILAKRDGKNLVITLDEGNTDPDIIIENYYADDNVNSMIIGLHENGNIYAYVPESGQTADAVSMLAEEMVKPQALGGEELKAALWEFNPWWLVGLAVLGVGIALIPRGKKGSAETVPTNAEVDTVTNSTEVNEGETLVTTVTLTNSNGNPSVAFSRGGNATDADFGPVTFSDGVTQNSDGTLKVPVGISHFTITTPVIADNQTESTPETVSYTVGIVTGTEATIVDTSKTPPVAPTIAPDLTDPSDTGLSNRDDKTADNTPTFAIPALNEGETPVLYINGQQVASTFDATTNTITSTSILVDGTHQITTATQKDGLTSAQGPALSVLIDTKAPVINKAEVPTSGDKLVLTYNEALDPTNTAVANQFVVKVNGQSIVPTTVAVSGSTVTLTLADTQTIKKDQVVKVSYTDPSNDNDAKATQDIVGNDAVTLVDYNVINNSGVIIPPVAPTIAPDLTDPSDTGLSNRDDKTADNKPTFAIPALNEGESPVLYVDGVEVSSTFNQATNTITPTTILVDGTHQITTATQKDGLTSAQGPALSVLIDTKAPVINKAEVPTSGDKLVLTYNEALDPTNTAVANQFVVKVNGQSIVPTTVAVSGSTVTLTLADTQTIKKDQVVKVSYTDPSNANDAKATQDIVGNDAVTLVDYDVINNSGVIIPPVAPTIAPDLTDPSDTGLSNIDDKTADNTPTFAIPALNEGESPVLYVDGVEVASTFDEATNTITPTTILVDGTHQITTATQKDGLTSAQGPALSVVIDTKAPVINKAEVPTSGDKLVLTYNEALDPTNTAVANQFVVKVNGQSIVPTTVAVSGSTVTLTLADTQTIKKDQVVKVSYTDPSNDNDAKATQDIVGNDAVTLVDYNVINNSGVIIPPVAPTIAPDLTDPSDTGLSNRDDKTADDTPTFAIPALNEGETPVLYVDGVEVSSTFDQATNTITPTAALVDGTYQITTATQKDGLTSAQGPALSVLIDTKAPVINKAEVPTSGDKLVLTYNEALDPTNTAVANQFVVKVNGQSIVPTTVAVSGSTVTLTLADTQTIKKGQTVTVSYTDPSNADDAKVTQDIVGNDAVTLVDYNVINNSGVIIPPVAPTIAPDLTDPSDTGLSHLDDKTADDTPTFAIPALNEGETPVLYVDGVEVSSTFNQATNTITPTSILVDGTHQITTATQKDGLTSAQGPALSVLIDTKAPVINKAEVPTSGDKLVLTYNEALDPTNTAVANQFVVKVNGQSIVPASVAVSGSTVTLTLPGTQTIKKDQVVKVSYTDPSNANDAKATQDIVGNDAVTLVDYNVINNSGVIIPPVAPTIAPDLTDPSDTGLSNRDDKTADNTPSFAIPALNEGETPVLYVDGVEVASTFDQATNTITPTAALVDGTYQITTATQKDGLTSAQGPALSVLIDTKAPVINKAEVPTSGDKLVLTYNEALDPTNTAVANQFVVKVNGQSIVPTTVAVSGSTVTLTLADTQTIKKDQTVTVSYTDPSNADDAKATQDIVGNDAVTLVDYNVINNSNIPVLGTPSAGKTVTDVNVIVPTNDIKLSNVNSTFGPVVSSSHEMTPDADGKTIAWPGIRGGTASIKLQDNAAGVVDGEDINSTFEVAAILHNNVVTARNLRQTSINLEATITLNGKDTRLNTTEIGTVYMLETPRNSSGNLIPGVPDEDFFIFVPKPISLTIDGQLYSFNLAATNINDSNTNRALVENALPIIEKGSYRTTIPAGLQNLTEAEKATAIYTSSPETGSENLVQFGFKLEPVSAGAIRPVGLPAPYTGQVADTNAAWTSGTAQGVTITAKSANTFAVNKNGVEIGEFAGQTNGSYTFKPTAGIKGIDGGETLVATFNKGDHTVSLNLTGKYSNTVAADEDKVDTIYKIKADSPKDIDFKSIGDVEMIDLSLVTAGTLQNVTKAQVTASQNNGLYIKGDVGDSVVLGDVLQVGATTQTDGSGSWTKGATKTGSTIDGDTKVYDIWTNSGTTLYIEQGISVL